MFPLRLLSKNKNCITFYKNYVTLVQLYQSSHKDVSTGELLSRNSSLHTSALLCAKSKDRKKEKGKSKVEINETQLGEVLNIESFKSQMQRAVDLLKDDYIKHLSVRSNAGSIEGIIVELDGKTHTLQELAQIVRKNPKTIVVNMSVFPQAIPAALKAIEKSGMNLNPQQDGTTLFIPIPKVTTEHRENLAKNAKTLFIKCRDAVRDVQNRQVKQIKKKDKLSEDIARNSEQQIIAIANSFISQAEKIFESKQKELLGKD